MADYDAGQVGSVPVGSDNGVVANPPPPMNLGAIDGLVGSVPRGGGENIRDIPLLTRDVP